MSVLARIESRYDVPTQPNSGRSVHFCILVYSLTQMTVQAGARSDPMVSEIDPHVALPHRLGYLWTSGSMKVDRFRTGQAFVRTRWPRPDPPATRVGLITYGSPSRSTANGWLVKQTDHTDLDTVYAK